MLACVRACVCVCASIVLQYEMLSTVYYAYIHVHTNESMQNALLKVRTSTVVLLVMEHVNNHWYLVQGFVE